MWTRVATERKDQVQILLKQGHLVEEVDEVLEDRDHILEIYIDILKHVSNDCG